MTWPDSAPENDYEQVAQWVRAAMPDDSALPETSTDAAAATRTLWLFGDPNLSDNRGYNRITVWSWDGREEPNTFAQHQDNDVSAVRVVTFNFRLWARDLTSADLRMRALYNAIAIGIGQSDTERGPIVEKRQGFKSKTASGVQVTLTFDVRLSVLASDLYLYARTEIDPSLPARSVINTIGALSVVLNADGQDFGPIVNQP